MARWVTHRTDNGSKALIKYAESIGFVYCAVEGVIDGVLALGQQTVAIDWKSKGGTLTTNQQRLIAKGFPLRFLSKPEQLDALKAELLRGAA